MSSNTYPYLVEEVVAFSVVVITVVILVVDACGVVPI